MLDITTITETSLILMACTFVAAIVVLCYGLAPYRRARKFENPALPQPGMTCPKASVLLFSQTGEENLLRVLSDLSQQDYPDYEIIVICDSDQEHAAMISERIHMDYPDIYVTFIQPGSHNLSRRKLATTIGIKAAKGEIIVTTIANVSIPSAGWLSRIMAPFCGEQGKYYDISLGMTRIDPHDLTGVGKWYRQFDDLLSDALWIGYAANHKGYRGDGYNLAFRRSVFFDHKGYAKSVNLHGGDDDLFIHEIATGSNMAVTLDKESIIQVEWGRSVGNKEWALRKERYGFTSRWLPKAPFINSFVMMGMQWVLPALAVATAFVGLPSIIPAIVAGIIWLGVCGVEIYEYRKLAARAGMTRLWWGVVPFWMWRPIGDLLFRFNHRHSRKRLFTWQR